MWLIIVTFAFMVIDFVSGIIKALYNKEFSSTIMRKGLIAKGGSSLIIAVGFLLDYAQTLADFGFNIPLAEATCVYVIVMEVGSIIENIGAIDSNLIPPKIRELFYKINDTEDKKGE